MFIKKFIIIQLLSLGLLNVSCQNIIKYKNNQTIFLGSYTEDSIKVFSKNKIAYIPKKDISNFGRISTDSLLNLMNKHNLQFVFSGNEPFWELSIIRNKLIFEDNEKKVVKIQTVVEENLASSTLMMFSSSNGSVFGLIKKVVPKENNFGYTPENACYLSVTEEFTTYECYLSFYGKIYKGCGMIDYIE